MKSKVCRCSCKGWCSLYEVLSFLRWSFEALADQEYPSTRHDDLPFDDPIRIGRAGTPLAVRGALVQIKGDWAEFAHSLGFPAWNSRCHPCIFCKVPAEVMTGELSGTTPPLTFDLNSDLDYHEACARCEHRVAIDESTHARLCACLLYDLRPDGARGRSLTRSFPSLGLLVGDRLEPSHELRDIAKFDEMTGFPRLVLFWRPATETLAKHRNPLLSPSLGTGLGTLAIDTLHTLHLGVLKRFVMWFLWRVVDRDVYGVARAGHRTADECLLLSCNALRNDLWNFYGRYHAQHPGANLSRLQDLRPSMLGTRSDPCLRTKAAETFGLLLFCADLAPKITQRLGPQGPDTAQLAAALARHMAIMDESPKTISPEAYQEPGQSQSGRIDLREMA